MFHLRFERLRTRSIILQNGYGRVGHELFPNGYGLARPIAHATAEAYLEKMYLLKTNRSDYLTVNVFVVMRGHFVGAVF